MGQGESKKIRPKYTRPCDECSRRRVRCEQIRPCFRCKDQDIPCKDKRGRRKPGPKINLDKTRHEIDSYGADGLSNLDTKMTNISFDELFPFLQMYQSWFYGIWPVLSIDNLTGRILETLKENKPDEGFYAYALGCAVCAAISRRINSVTSDEPIKIPNSHQPNYFAAEVLRIRYLNNHRDKPCEDTLLSCFFLYCYYGISDGGIPSAISYLREAISIAQILRLHDINIYTDMGEQEVHRMRKVYYMILITERYMCIEDKLPIVLDPTIPYPTLENEEYPTILEGFMELVRVFSSPNRKFFENISKDLHTSSLANIFEQLLQGSDDSLSAQLIIKIQDRLQAVNIKNYMSEIQQVNVLLSQHWMKCLAWHISKKQLLLTDMTSENCLSMQFPIKIARDFLSFTEHLPLFAFELNGRGARLKLLEIADSLAESYTASPKFKYHYDEIFAPQVLERIFKLIGSLKSNVPLPKSLYHNIETIINSRSLAASEHLVNLFTENLAEFNDETFLTNELFSHLILASDFNIVELSKNESSKPKSRILALSQSDINNFRVSAEEATSYNNNSS